MPTSRERLVFRSRVNLLLAAIAWALCALIAGSLLITGDPELMSVALVAACAAFVVWLSYWNPAIVVDDDAVTIINVTRTITVPWAAIVQVDTKYAVTVVTAESRFPATAAPAPGAFGTYLANRDYRHVGKADRQTSGTSMRPSDLSGSDSGRAADMILRRWNDLTEAGRVPAVTESGSTPVAVRVHLAHFAVLAALVAATVLMLAFT